MPTADAASRADTLWNCSKGQRILIVVRPKGTTSQLFAGQRVQITGRLAEICVDDPFEQAGRVTIEEGSIKY